MIVSSTTQTRIKENEKIYSKNKSVNDGSGNTKQRNNEKERTEIIGTSIG